MSAWLIYLLAGAAIFAVSVILYKLGARIIDNLSARIDKSEQNAAKAATQELRADTSEATNETLTKIDKANQEYQGAEDALLKKRF